MFGYIKIFKPELKIKEYEVYKGIYCSLCKQIGRDYGLISRFTLNYDFTFLALIRMSLNEKAPVFEQSHCSFNCTKKCLSCDKDNDDLKYTSAISMMIIYHKIIDNIHDSKFIKKIPYYISVPYVKLKYNKAVKLFPDIAAKISSLMSEQRKTEQSKDNCIDSSADASATSLGYILSYGYEGDKKVVAEYLGYCIGKLIYILDAFDDIEDDEKNNSYNAFLLNRDKYSDLNKSVEELLNITADECAKAYELLPVIRFKTILENIIYYGFESTIKSIMNKEGKCKDESI